MRIDGWRILSEKSTAWAVKLDNGEVIAFAPQCTHLGCAYHWDDPKKQFLCPCHSSVFSIDGKVISGPAPRPLDRYDAGSKQQADARGNPGVEGIGGMTPAQNPEIKPAAGLLRRFAEWADHRTGLETGVRNFLYEEIPASSGWHQVLGSVVVFLFMLQAFTGVLLAFNYAPTRATPITVCGTSSGIDGRTAHRDYH
jgi:nitrite reductase/ring-hydroxylating ferredoxin subunit